MKAQTYVNFYIISAKYYKTCNKYTFAIVKNLKF